MHEVAIVIGIADGTSQQITANGETGVTDNDGGSHWRKVAGWGDQEGKILPRPHTYDGVLKALELS
jgi:hypothetical protein